MPDVQVYEGNGQPPLPPPPTTTGEMMMVMRPLLMPYKDLDVWSATVTRGGANIRLEEAKRLVREVCNLDHNVKLQLCFKQDYLYSSGNQNFDPRLYAYCMVEWVIEAIRKEEEDASDR